MSSWCYGRLDFWLWYRNFRSHFISEKIQIQQSNYRLFRINKLQFIRKFFVWYTFELLEFYGVGGVTSMPSFLEKFFPDVYRKEVQNVGGTNQYCKFNSPKLTLFTSSLYLAALVASIFASGSTRAFGRRLSMLFGGSLFLAGAVLNGFAQNVKMLIGGRALLGFGIGFANQV